MPGLRLLSPKDNDSNNSSQSLVVLFPWLYSTERAVRKYCEIYLERNMEVLVVDVELKHFLWPSHGRAAVRTILDALQRNERTRHRQDVLVHSFSIGSYLYTVLMMEMAKHPDKYALFRDKIRAQVFDSITVGGLDRMSVGVARMVDNPTAQTLLKVAIRVYLFLTKRHTAEFYDQAVHHFKYKPLNLPSLFLYCENDPMASCDSMRAIISLWTEGGDNFVGNMDVHEKCWEKSVHAGHLKEHTDEYLAVISDFLRHVQLDKTRVKSRL